MMYSKIFRKFACVMGGLMALSSVGFAVPDGVYSDKYAAIVVDAHSNEILFEENSNVRRYPASLTKMMTVYMLFDALHSGRLRASTLIPISSYAASRPPTKIGLKPGQTVPALVAAQILITKSANDVAAAVGEYLGGTEQKFAQKMTQKARQLGMMRTNFTNASGLPDKENYSTARDMAILSLALRDHFPREYALFNQTRVTFRGRDITGHNRLVRSMEGVDGIKTGYTNMSGFNLASSRRLGNKSIVAVLMGGRTAAVRDAHMSRLLTAYMEKASEGRGRRQARGSMVFAKVTPVKQEPVKQERVKQEVVELASTKVPLPVVKEVSRGASQHMLTSASSGRAFSQSAKRKFDEVDQLIAQSNREHDSAFLTALLSEPSETSAAANAANQLIVHGMPVPVSKKSVTVVSELPDDRGWAIQLASLPSEIEAKRILKHASRMVYPLLEKTAAYTELHQNNKSRYYRARFTGFTSRQSADYACSQLREVNFDCYSLRD